MIHKTPLFYNDMSGFKSRIKKLAKIKNKSFYGYIVHKTLNNFYSYLADLVPVGKIRIFYQRKRGVVIGNNVSLASGMVLERAFPEYITIEDNVAFGPGVKVITHSIPPINFRRKVIPHVSPVIFKKGCWIGAYSIILPGCTIGKGSIVSAGSVVNTNVADNCIVQGNPAQVIHKFRTRNK